jgi:hypothetical protein
MPKYRDERVIPQADHYWDLGYRDDMGLWAAGIMARVHAMTESIMGDWLLEIDRWTIQDQLSLPFVLWRHGCGPTPFPADLYRNPWLTVTGHNPNY